MQKKVKQWHDLNPSPGPSSVRKTFSTYFVPLSQWKITLDKRGWVSYNNSSCSTSCCSRKEPAILPQFVLFLATVTISFPESLFPLSSSRKTRDSMVLTKRSKVILFHDPLIISTYYYTTYLFFICVFVKCICKFKNLKIQYLHVCQQSSINCFCLALSTVATVC